MIKQIKAAAKVARMWAMAAVAAVALAVVYGIKPDNLPIAIWKLGLLTVAAVLGYYIDRNLFPYARPHTLIHPQLQSAFGTATIRRAIIVAATMVAYGLAL